jgi:hypothetical protein
MGHLYKVREDNLSCISGFFQVVMLVKESWSNVRLLVDSSMEEAGIDVEVDVPSLGPCAVEVRIPRLPE